MKSSTRRRCLPPVLALQIALLLSVALVGAAAATTYWVRPSPHGHGNNGVQCLPGGVAWLVSDAGRVCKTTDYGVTWTMIEAFKGVGVRLRDVAFESPTHGAIIGAAGTIYVTWDGGVNWTTSKLSAPSLLSDIEWSDANTAVVVGDGLLVARTTDGGATWTTLPLLTAHPYAVRYVGANTWYIAGQNNIWRSTDNGATWGSIWNPSITFYGIDFSDANNGIAVGSSAIYRTSNGGGAWTTATGAVSNTHWDVRYLSPSIAITATQSGQVARSVDGGASWLNVNLQTPGGFILYAASFWDANTGLVVGNFGEIQYTADAGVTWQRRTLRLDNQYGQVENVTDLFRTGGSTWFVTSLSGLFRTDDEGQTFTRLRLEGGFKSVSFRDAMNGIAIGDSVYRTSNGGATWTKGVPLLPTSIDWVRYGPGGVALLVGSHGIFRSTNDGVTWTSVFYLAGSNMRSVAWVDNDNVFVAGSLAKRSTDAGATWANLPALNGTRDLSFATPLVGTAIEGPGGARFIRTVDGGLTWAAPPSQLAINPPPVMRRVAMSDPYTAWAVGDSGVVMHTTNGGASWVRTSSTTNVPLNVVVVIDDSTAVVGGGQAIGASSGAIVVVTSRSAQTPAVWNLGTSGTSITLMDVAFADASVGVMCGLGGMLRTTNGGANWTSVVSGPTLYGVTFISTTEAIAVGVGGVVMRSADAGASWTTIASGTTAALLDVGFASPLVGCAVGSNVMLRTTDGGLNWTPVASGAPPSSNIYGVAFADASLGLSVSYGSGGTSSIQRTTDGGATWTPVASLPLTALLDVAFASPSVAVAVGGGGGLYGSFATRSTNGGLTWTTAAAEGNQQLYGVAFTAATEGFAVGQAGTILHTTNGGANWLYEATDIQPPPAASGPAPAPGEWSPFPGLESIRPATLLAGPDLFGVGIRPAIGPVVVGASGTASIRVTPLVAGVGDGLRGPAARLFLAPGRPNPLRGGTLLEFELPAAGHARVRIYDVTGAVVATVADRVFSAGRHSLRWSPGRAPSGVYFAQVESRGQRASAKLVVVN